MTRRTTSATATGRAVAAGLTVTALLGLAAAPGSAAAPVAEGTASAVVVSVAGSPSDSGTFTATHDGATQSTTGTNKPVITALGGQSLVSAGVLAQDSTTSVVDGQGQVTSCAGLAGQGATVVAAGDGGCLSGGQTLRLSAATLDLSGLTIVEGTALQGLDQQVATALQPVLGQVLPALSQGLRQGLEAIGNPGVFVDLGAVQSRCTATPTAATGDATLAGSGVYVEMMGRRVDLLALPADPEPNTTVVTNLDAVSALVRETLRTQLTQALDGALGPLAGPIDRAAVVDTVLANLSAQLAPLDENLLSATLNRQTSTGAGQIAVDALDLQVLPAAAAELGAEALRLQVGRSTCSAGTAAPVAVASAPVEAPEVEKPSKGLPAVPRTVPAGVAEAPERDGDTWALALLSGLVLAGLLAAGTRRHG